MNFDLETVIKQIVNSPKFIALKDIVEVNGGHDHESVYDHSFATLGRMKNLLEGSEIKNTDAREKFDKLLEEDSGGIRKRELLAIAALLHDIGKSVSFIVKDDGTTESPDHASSGSVLINEFVSQVKLPSESIGYLSDMIRLHMGPRPFDDPDEFVEYIKNQCGDLYVDELLLMHCDLFNNPKYDKNRTVKILNNPEFYEN